LLEGEEKTYYEDGKVASVIPYQNGKIHGNYQQWNRQGVLVFDAEYKDGERHGKLNKYYDDGKPYLVQKFSHDQLHGIKQSFDKDGKLTESQYDNGKKIR
jgi:uncharacterized protein